MIYVARHGETDWNREGRYQGQRESHLTQIGHAQADALAAALADRGITRVIASPLARCVDTARPLARLLGVDLETDRDLLEIAHGAWEGRLRTDIEREEPELMRTWREHPEQARFPGGETIGEVDARWRAFAHRLDGADDVAIVTHDVVVRAAILAATNRPLSELWGARVLNGGYAVFRGGGTWELIDPCVEAHLRGLAVDTASQAL